MNTVSQEKLVMQLNQCVALLQHGRPQTAGQRGAARQDKLLSLLTKMDIVNQTDLVNILDSRPTSVKELIGKLERLEPVDRRQGGSDRRQHESERRRIGTERRRANLFMTQKRKATASEADDTPVDRLADAFADFTEAEVSQFSALLSKLLARLEIINASGSPQAGSPEESCVSGRNEQSGKA